MKILAKIVAILVEIGALYALYANHIINGQSAVVIAIITIIFVLVIAVNNS